MSQSFSDLKKSRQKSIDKINKKLQEQADSSKVIMTFENAKLF